MILSSAVENAFDRLQLSFIPVDVFHPTDLKLHIWDESCVSDEIGSGNASDQASDVSLYGRVRTTIGDFRDALLQVPPACAPSRRALSYQAMNAYLFNKSRRDMSFAADEPADFSSEFEGKDEVRRQLAGVLRTSIKEESGEADDIEEQ